MTQDESVYFRYYLKNKDKKQQKYAAYNLKLKGREDISLNVTGHMFTLK